MSYLCGTPALRMHPRIPSWREAVAVRTRCGRVPRSGAPAREARRYFDFDAGFGFDFGGCDGGFVIEAGAVKYATSAYVGTLRNKRDRRIVHCWGTEFCRTGIQLQFKMFHRGNSPANAKTSASASGLPSLSSFIIICCSVIAACLPLPSLNAGALCKPDPIMLSNKFER